MKRTWLLLFVSSACSTAVDVPLGGVDAAVRVDASILDAIDTTAADATTTDATIADAGAGDVAPRDPFARQPDTSEGLTNVSADLDALLEHGALATACAESQADPSDRRKRLLCGKWMFFYEGFDTIGIPQAIVDFYPANLTAEVGVGFSAFGMIADPGSAEGRPLGLAPGRPVADNVPSLAFTCASCHFARLPDGRYAVGAANHDFDYGRLVLSLMLPPTLVSPRANEADHHPDAVAAVRPILDRLQMDRRLRTRLLLELLPLLGVQNGAPALSIETEGHYAHWPVGTMDFVIAPLPIDDGVHTVSKTISLFGIPTPQERAEYGMDHARLAWTGGAESLLEFLGGFVSIGDGDPTQWPESRLLPLAEYIHSLAAPLPMARPSATRLADGRALFDNAGCIECHDGPRGSSRGLYEYSEIGTDPAMIDWGRDLAFIEPGTLTRKLKAPRLVGAWAMKRFLHNGALDSLEQLLCVQPRAGNLPPPHGDQGHTYGCDRPEADRVLLIEYLRAH